MIAPIRVDIRKRIFFLFLIMFSVFFALILRVGWLQLVRGGELAAKATEQWGKMFPVEPMRGPILDSKGRILAQSATSMTVIGSPPEVKDPAFTAKQLAKVLDPAAEDFYYKQLTKKVGMVYIERKIPDNKAEAVRKLNLPGIRLIEEGKRFYPNGSLAANILGIVGIDSQGLEGLELYYDSYLRGTPGGIVFESDASGRELPFGNHKFIEPVPGNTLVLTIDQVIQHIAERELDKVMLHHNPKKAAILIMEPKTGNILALAQRPTFDPNHFAKYSAEERKNWLFTEVYPPGSTFKIVTAAAGLEEGVVKETDRFYDPGYVTVEGVTLHCWKDGGHGSQTFVQVLQNSCNPGFIEIGRRLGRERFLKYIRGFGFGEVTGVVPEEFGAEVSGFIQDKLGPVELATMAFGQGISVTPIQVLTALSAEANGGKLLKPHLIKEIRDPKGNLVKKYEPEVVRQVISPETARELNLILESVVTNGTGKRAFIPGYRVAGKTGTATIEGGADSIYIASFGGFAPANDPQIAILVLIWEPKGEYFGGVIAAPVFKEVAQDVLRYLQVPPQLDAAQEPAPTKVVVPNFKNLGLSEARKLLAEPELGLIARFEGQGTRVIDQTPKAGAQVDVETTVLLKLGNPQVKPGDPVLPDLTGKTMREVTDILGALGLHVRIAGSGFAVRQDPAAGTKVPAGSVVTVYFAPPAGQ